MIIRCHRRHIERLLQMFVKNHFSKMEWPTAAQLFGSEPLPTSADSDQLRPGATSGFLPNTCTLYEAVLEEAALEGIDGVTFSTLLQRLAHREDFTGDVFLSSIKAKVAKCITSAPHMRLYKLNTDRPDLVEQCYDERVAYDRTLRFTTLLNAENEIVDRNALVMPPPPAFNFGPPSSQAQMTDSTFGPMLDASAAVVEENDENDTIAGDSTSVTSSTVATSTLDAVMACEKLAAVSLHAAYPYFPIHRSKEAKKEFGGNSKVLLKHLGSCAEYFTRVAVNKSEYSSLAAGGIDDLDCDTANISLFSNKIVVVASTSRRCSMLTQCSKWLDYCFTLDGYIILEYLGRCRSRATYTSANCLFNWDPKCRPQDVHYFIDGLLSNCPVIVKQFQFHVARNLFSSNSLQLPGADDQQHQLPNVKTSAYAHRLVLLRFFSRTGNSLDHFILTLINRLRGSTEKWIPKKIMQAEFGDKLIKFLMPQLSFIKAVAVARADVERRYPGAFSNRFSKTVSCFQYKPTKEVFGSSNDGVHTLSWLIQACLLMPVAGEKSQTQTGSFGQNAVIPRTAIGNSRTVTQNPSLNDAYSMACAALDALPSIFVNRQQPYELLQRSGRNQFSRMRALTGARLQPRDISMLCEQSNSCSRQLFRGIMKEIGLQERRKKRQQQKMLEENSNVSGVADAISSAPAEELDDASLPVDEQQIAYIAAECVKQIQARHTSFLNCMERNDWIALVSEYLPSNMRNDWKLAFPVAVVIFERVLCELKALKLSYMAFELSSASSSSTSSPFLAEAGGDEAFSATNPAAEQFLYAAIPTNTSSSKANEAAAKRKLCSLACEQRLQHKLRQHNAGRMAIAKTAPAGNAHIPGLRPASTAAPSITGPLDDGDVSIAQPTVADDTKSVKPKTNDEVKENVAPQSGFLFHALPDSVREDYNAHENVNYPRVFQYKAIHHLLLGLCSSQRVAVDAPQQTRQLFFLFNDLMRATPVGLLLRLAARSLRAEFFAGVGPRAAAGWWLPLNCRRMLAHESTQRIPFGRLPLLLRNALSTLFDRTLKRTLIEMAQIGIIRLVQSNNGSEDLSAAQNDEQNFIIPAYKAGVAPLNNYTRIVLHTHYYFIDTTWLCRSTNRTDTGVAVGAENAARDARAALIFDATKAENLICYRELKTHAQVENLWIDLTELARVTEQRSNSALNSLDRRAILEVLVGRLKHAAESDERWPLGVVGYPRLMTPGTVTYLATSSSVPGPCGIDAAIRLQNTRVAFLPAYRVQELQMPMRLVAASAGAPSTEVASRMPIARVPEWDMPLGRSMYYRAVEQDLIKQAKSSRSLNNAPVVIPESVCRRIRAFIDDVRANRDAQKHVKSKQKTGTKRKKTSKAPTSPQSALLQFAAADVDRHATKREPIETDDFVFGYVPESDDDDDYKYLLKFEEQRARLKKKQKIEKNGSKSISDKNHKAKFHTTWVRRDPDDEHRQQQKKLAVENGAEANSKPERKNTTVMLGMVLSMAFRNLFVPWHQQHYYATNENCSSFSPVEQTILAALAVAPLLLRSRTQLSPLLFSFVCRSALLPDCFARTTFMSMRRAYASLMSSKCEGLVKQCLEIVRVHPVIAASSLFNPTTNNAELLSLSIENDEHAQCKVFIPAHKSSLALSREQMHAQLLYAHGVGLCASVLLSHMLPNVYADIMLMPLSNNTDAADRLPKQQIICAGSRHLTPHAGMSSLGDVQRGLVMSFILSYASSYSLPPSGSIPSTNSHWTIVAPRVLAAMRRHPSVLYANFVQQQSSLDANTAAQLNYFKREQQQFPEAMFKQAINVMKRMSMVAYAQRVVRNQAARYQYRQEVSGDHQASEAALQAENRMEVDSSADAADVEHAADIDQSNKISICGYMTTANFNSVFEPGSTARRLAAAIACQAVCEEISKNTVPLVPDSAEPNILRFSTPRLAILRSLLTCCSGDKTFCYNMDEPDDSIRANCFASRDGLPMKPRDISLGAISRLKALDGTFRVRNAPRKGSNNADMPTSGTFMRSLPFSNVTRLCYEDQAKLHAESEWLWNKFEVIAKADEAIFPLNWCDSVSRIRGDGDGAHLTLTCTQTARLAVTNWVLRQYDAIAMIPAADKSQKIVDSIVNVFVDITQTSWRGASLVQLVTARRSLALCRKAVRALLECKLVLRTGTAAVAVANGDDGDGAAVGYVAFPYAQDHLLTAFVENYSLPKQDEAADGAAGDDPCLRRTHYYEPRPWKCVGVEQSLPHGSALSNLENESGKVLKPGQCDRAALIRYYRAVLLIIDQGRLTVAQYSNVSAALLPRVQPFHVRLLLEHMSQLNMVALSAPPTVAFGNVRSKTAVVDNGIYADQNDFMVELLPQAVANLLSIEKHYDVTYSLPQHYNLS